MFNAKAFSQSTCEPYGDMKFCLEKNIAAIQVLPDDGRGEPRLGTITQLPYGAELRICGDGFNERTVRVQWAQGTYFVFLQDIEVPAMLTAAG